MTDTQKLQYIETLSREAFAPAWAAVDGNTRDAHRLQALANIFALFEYNGATVPELFREPAAEEIKPQPAKQNENITLFDLLGGSTCGN